MKTQLETLNETCITFISVTMKKKDLNTKTEKILVSTTNHKNISILHRRNIRKDSYLIRSKLIRQFSLIIFTMFLTIER